MKSDTSGSGPGSMSWRTISDSTSDGVLTMSRKSFGTHCKLAPPMITMRGAMEPRLQLELWEPAGRRGEHLVGHGHDVVVSELTRHRIGHHRLEHERAV